VRGCSDLSRRLGRFSWCLACTSWAKLVTCSRPGNGSSLLLTLSGSFFLLHPKKPKRLQFSRLLRAGDSEGLDMDAAMTRKD
jgi:hypothetical protein